MIMTSADVGKRTKTLEEIARAYDSPPWWYDVRGFFILTFAYRSTLTYQLRFFSRNLGDQHLEVAVGSGSLLDIILRWASFFGIRRPRRIAGIDYALPMLAGAVRRFFGDKSVELHHGDVAAMPFDDEEFDTANIANAIHCFPCVDDGLHEIFRVLKPGGTLAVNALLYASGPQPLRAIAQRINDWGTRKGILTTPFDREDILRRVRAAGFEIASEEISGNTSNFVARKPQL